MDPQLTDYISHPEPAVIRPSSARVNLQFDDANETADNVPLIAPRGKYLRDKLRQYAGCISLFLWILGNILCIIWGYFYQKISIFPLSEENINIQKSTFGAAIFNLLYQYWTVIVAGFNLCMFWISVGPVITTRPATDQQGTAVPGNAQATPAQPPFPSLTDFRPKWRRWTVIRLGRMVLAGSIALTLGIIFTGLMGYPGWWIFPSQAIWQRKAWQDEVCQGWDYKITFDGIDFTQLGMETAEGEGQFYLSNATIVPSTGGLPIGMTLEHPGSYISLITISDNNENSTIEFNFTSSSYNSTFNTTPQYFRDGYYNLAFPDLKMKNQPYSNIAWSPLCEAPQVSIIDGDQKEVFRTILSNFDDCTQMRACGNGPFDRLSVVTGFVLTEMEKSGLCCTNPESLRLPASDPTAPSEDVVCLMMSPYLYPGNEDIVSNPDISGVGIRRTIYTQTFLNQIIAASAHDEMEGLAVNAANAVALSAIAFATAFINRPDFPHLIIIYHYFLLLSFSGVSYYTIRRSFRKSSKFGPLMQRLEIIDLYSGPLFGIVTIALWVNLWLVQNRLSYFPKMVQDCNFGYWEVLGQTLDLKTRVAVLIGLILGILLVGWFLLSILISAYIRSLMYLKAKDAIRRRYGPGLPSGQRPLPADCNITIVGDFVAAALWKKSMLLFPIKFKLWRWRIRITLREIVILVRLLFWGYLVAETERMITINNLTDENQWTYGQISALILLLVPISGLWKVCYRGMALFRRHFDSYVGQNQLLYSFGGLMGIIQFTAAVGILGASPSIAFTLSLGLVSIIVSGLIETIWCTNAISFDKLLGNQLYPPASSFWQLWFFYHEIKISGHEEPTLPPTDGPPVDDATELQEIRQEVSRSPSQEQDGATEELPAEQPARQSLRQNSPGVERDVAPTETSTAQHERSGTDQTSTGVEWDEGGVSDIRRTALARQRSRERRDMFRRAETT